MKLIPRVSDFPFSLIQENRYWCIAACIEAVLGYFGICVEGFQSKFSAMALRGDYNFIIAVSVLDHLKGKNKQEFDGLSFETNSLNLEGLVSKIRETIDLGYPIIISIPVTLGAHAIVFVGYSEDGNYFAFYDPGKSQQNYTLMPIDRLRSLIPDGRDYIVIKRNKI